MDLGPDHVSYVVRVYRQGVTEYAQDRDLVAAGLRDAGSVRLL